MDQQTALQTWMDANGYSRSQLANELGVSYHTIYNAVKNRREISNGFKWSFMQRFGRNEAEKVFGAAQEPEAELA